MFGEGTTKPGWTEKTDPMPYTDTVFFTMAGKKQSFQCQSCQTPTNPTSEESRKVWELLRGIKTSCLILERSSFKEPSRQPECRGDLHKSDQSQRRVQEVCLQMADKRWTLWPQPADRPVHWYIPVCSTQRHIINLGTWKKIVFKNLTLLFVFVCVNNLFNFKNEPLADEDAVDIAWSTNKPNQIVVVSLLGEVLVLQTCRKRYHQPSTICE